MGGHSLKTNKYTTYRKRPETFSVVKFDDPANPPKGVEWDDDYGDFQLHTPSGTTTVVVGHHYIVTDMTGMTYAVPGEVWDATHEEV